MTVVQRYRIYAIYDEGDEKIRDYHTVVCGQSLGISDGRYAYIWFGDTGKELLFDHDTDPRETKDLADLPEYQSIKERLNQALTDHLIKKGDKNIVDGALNVRPSRWPIDHNRFTARGMNRGRC